MTALFAPALRTARRSEADGRLTLFLKPFAVAEHDGPVESESSRDRRFVEPGRSERGQDRSLRLPQVRKRDGFFGVFFSQPINGRRDLSVDQ